MRSFIALIVLVLALVSGALAAPAEAQWTPVPEVPSTQLFSFFTNDDTVAAGADTTVHLSVNGGQTWTHSTNPVTGVRAITALLVRNGRLYAGTFGQGVFVSDNRGATWSAFNQGLVGGFQDSQLDLVDLRVRGDSIYAATAGAGVYVRGLGAGGTWAPFGTELEPNQASNVNGLALGGTHLLVQGGSNGQVFFNDPGDGDWSTSDLDNVGLHPGVSAFYGKWNGLGWVIGTNAGVFRSVDGVEPWTRTDVGFGPLTWTAFATIGSRYYGVFDTFPESFIEASDDGGATWHDEEDFPGVFIRDLGISRDNLYAARGDGLWRRLIDAVAVAPGSTPAHLGFALAGSQPIGDRAQLRFTLAQASEATIAVFDVHGRMLGDCITGVRPAGPQAVSLDARRLPPGVYSALLTVKGVKESVRLVRVR